MASLINYSGPCRPLSVLSGAMVRAMCQPTRIFGSPTLPSRAFGEACGLVHMQSPLDVGCLSRSPHAQGFQTGAMLRKLSEKLKTFLKPDYGYGIVDLDDGQLRLIQRRLRNAKPKHLSSRPRLRPQFRHGGKELPNIFDLFATEETEGAESETGVESDQQGILADTEVVEIDHTLPLGTVDADDGEPPNESAPPFETPPGEKVIIPSRSSGRGPWLSLSKSLRGRGAPWTSLRVGGRSALRHQDEQFKSAVSHEAPGLEETPNSSRVQWWLKTRPIRPAAVLVPLCIHEDQPSILLTLRSGSVRTHRHQVSFPGGSVEEGDTSIVSTAIRETREELGFIDPIRVLGVFQPSWAVSNEYFFHVTPVVGFMGNVSLSDDFDLYEPETADIFTLSLSQLRDDAYRERKDPSVFSEMFLHMKQVDSYTSGKYEVWGFTAHTLDRLMRWILNPPLTGDEQRMVRRWRRSQ